MLAQSMHKCLQATLERHKSTRCRRRKSCRSSTNTASNSPTAGDTHRHVQEIRSRPPTQRQRQRQAHRAADASKRAARGEPPERRRGHNPARQSSTRYASRSVRTQWCATRPSTWRWVGDATGSVNMVVVAQTCVHAHRYQLDACSPAYARDTGVDITLPARTTNFVVVVAVEPRQL